MTDAVSLYRQLGWSVMPCHALAKTPRDGASWGARPSSEPHDFAPHDNIGVRLGQPSGGLIDIDLDCSEAIVLAPGILPPTWCFGRPSKPRSHYVYLASTGAQTSLRRLTTSHHRDGSREKGMLVELRASGAYTIFPGSIHETGELISWESIPAARPTELTEQEIKAAFGRLSVACLVARIARDMAGNIHDLTLALAGALWRSGWTLEDAQSVLLPALIVGTGSEDNGHRAKAIEDTWDTSIDRNRFGWPAVAELAHDRNCRSLQRAAEYVGAQRTIEDPADGFALTDLGNSERIVQAVHHEMRYSKGLGWLLWRGDMWTPLKGEPYWTAAQVIRAAGGAAAALGRSDLQKWAVQSESAGKLRAMLELARENPALLIEPDELDADPWLLNAPNGTIDLRTGCLREHRAEDLITKQVPIQYEESASCPRFVQFLIECMDGNTELVGYLVTFLGYCLTGLTKEQCFGLWHGNQGANGKSTLFAVLEHVLGDYAGTVAPDLLIETRYSQHPTALMALRGKRLVVSSEAPEGKPWNESLMKRLTGGDRIQARYMAKDFVEFSPTHKIILAANSRPIVRERGGAFWRRVHMVPWSVSFENRKDVDLLDKLKDESQGILRLLVEGCLAWQRNGLVQPTAMRNALDEYREDMDSLRDFVDEHTQPAGDAVGEWVKVSELYMRYRVWCASTGVDALGKQVLNRKLKESGWETHGQGGTKRWQNRRLV